MFDQAVIFFLPNQDQHACHDFHCWPLHGSRHFGSLYTACSRPQILREILQPGHCDPSYRAFSDVYAPSAVFFNNDDEIYRGGNSILEWMKDLFRPFELLEFEHKGIEMLPLDSDNNDERRSKKRWRILTEHVMIACWKGELTREGIPVKGYELSGRERRGRGQAGTSCQWNWTDGSYGCWIMLQSYVRDLLSYVNISTFS